MQREQAGGQSPDHRKNDARHRRGYRISPTVREFLLKHRNGAGPDQESLNPSEIRVLQKLGIDRLLERELIHLSTGERHKVSIAKALFQHPRLLIFKEPFSGLDRRSRETLRLLLQNLLLSNNPQLVFLVSRVEDLVRGTTHAILLKNGRITAMGALEEVLPRLPIPLEEL